MTARRRASDGLVLVVTLGPMRETTLRERAARPEDLGRLFLERANAGDVDGVVALYEPDAVLVGPDGDTLVGTEAIRRFYAELLASRPAFAGQSRPALRSGDMALTSTRFATSAGASATAEVARRQADGSWLWAVDNPDVLA